VPFIITEEQVKALVDLCNEAPGRVAIPLFQIMQAVSQKRAPEPQEPPAKPAEEKQ
jgi:hypothetical protein